MLIHCLDDFLLLAVFGQQAQQGYGAQHQCACQQGSQYAQAGNDVLAACQRDVFIHDVLQAVLVAGVQRVVLRLCGQLLYGVVAADEGTDGGIALRVQAEGIVVSCLGAEQVGVQRVVLCGLGPVLQLCQLVFGAGGGALLGVYV